MWEYNYSNPYYSNELYHHGIKGQKWGVRRFQKKGGGLTSAGKKRYGGEERKKFYSSSEAYLKAYESTPSGKKKHASYIEDLSEGPMLNPEIERDFFYF